MMKKFNEFHTVTMSPWPLMASTQTYSMMMQIIFNNLFKMTKMLMTTYMLTLSLISLMWWKNTMSESNSEGLHQNKTMSSIKMSMIFFITSEVMFFLSFFWAYFHSMSSPNMEIGMMWPPTGIKSFNPINVPLLNTIILISSGFSITWSHHLMMKKMLKNSNTLLFITVVLGVYFSILQIVEYTQSEFSMSDSSFGNIFFMGTGFHGLHVIIGTTFLAVNLMSMKKLTLTNKHHMGFEMASWYWHFVDIVWLFLYMSIYWWSK